MIHAMPNFRRTEFHLEPYRIIAVARPARRIGILRIPILARIVPYMTGAEPGVKITLRLADDSLAPDSVKGQLVYIRADGVHEPVAEFDCSDPQFPMVIESRRTYLIQGGNHTFQLRLQVIPKKGGSQSDLNTMVRFNALDTDTLTLGAILAAFGGFIAYILGKFA